MKIKFLVIGLFLMISGAMSAADYTLTKSMPWDSIPFSTIGNYDEITIPAGMTLGIENVCDDLESYDIIINVYGTLSFATNGSNTDALYLSASSMITLYNNGVVTAVTCSGRKRIYFGGTLVSTCSGGTGSGTSTGYTHTSFSDINTSGGVSASGAVPVTWLSYEALVANHGNDILWSTASEKNNSFFEVEYSADGQNWQVVGFVPSQALGGNSDEILNYKFNHLDVMTGLSFYRLKQTDYDGEFSYSDVMVVDAADRNPIVISNESNQTVVINTTLTAVADVNVKVYTSTGRLVGSINLQETNRMVLSKPGVYFFEVTRNGNMEVIKHALL